MNVPKFIGVRRSGKNGGQVSWDNHLVDISDLHETNVVPNMCMEYGLKQILHNRLFVDQPYSIAREVMNIFDPPSVYLIHDPQDAKQFKDNKVPTNESPYYGKFFYNFDSITTLILSSSR